MLDLIRDLSTLAIVFAAGGFMFISFKNWWSSRIVNNLSKEDRELFKQVDSIANSLIDRQKEIDSVEKEETNKTTKEAIDEWNSKT